MKNIYLKKKKLPDSSGVYFFRKGKEILYIGKATSLESRTRSYFSKDLINTRGPLIVDMVFKAEKMDWQVTDSVLEALILEANLIKKHQPYYNTREKDDKSFNYVCITDEKLPRVLIIRGKALNVTRQSFSKGLAGRGTRGTEDLRKVLASAVFGPYTNSPQLREAMKIIRPIFPFLDEKFKNNYRFYRQIDLVPDVSTPEGIKHYKNNIKNLKLFFQGKKKRVLKNLEKDMKEYAKVREFEKAGEVKRQIFALKHINDIALLKTDQNSNFAQSLGPSLRSATPSQNYYSGLFKIEAYDIAHMGGKNMVGVMVVIQDSEINKSEYKKFKIKTQNNANDTGALVEVLERRLAHKEWAFPDLIVVDGGVAQINAAQKIISRTTLDIPVVAVVKDKRHKPKAIMGDEKLIKQHKSAILLANNEAHRFAIAYHKKMRNKNFLI